jgi:carbonic anhydrase
MHPLIEGVRRFRRETLVRYRERFEQLAREGQKPHTLFITCSDSRVLAELLTDSQPGDLFVVKNVGNIVPPATVTGSTNSTAAAIEFAVQALDVGDIVVCGHTQCGAMAALLDGLPASLLDSHLAAWLELAAPVRATVQRRHAHLTDPLERTTAAAQENVLFALENLRSYPAVAARLAAGTLGLHGWYFQIATAEVLAWNPDTRRFEPLGAD